MSTNTKKGIVAAILIVVMIVMLANAFKSQTPAQATPAATPPGAPTPADVPSPIQDAHAPDVAVAKSDAARQANLDLQRKRKALAWGRNPFGKKEDKRAVEARLARLAAATQKAATRTVSPPAWSIQAIMWGTRPRAVIGNKVLSEGDIAPDGSRILRIARNMITVAKGGQQFHLDMKQPTLPE